MSKEKFPEPWRVERVGEQEFIVIDANGTKLFYIVGDEGDGENADPSVLFWSEKDEDTNYVANRIIDMIEGVDDDDDGDGKVEKLPEIDRTPMPWWKSAT